MRPKNQGVRGASEAGSGDLHPDADRLVELSDPQSMIYWPIGVRSRLGSGRKTQLRSCFSGETKATLVADSMMRPYSSERMSTKSWAPVWYDGTPLRPGLVRTVVVKAAGNDILHAKKGISSSTEGPKTADLDVWAQRRGLSSADGRIV